MKSTNLRLAVLAARLFRPFRLPAFLFLLFLPAALLTSGPVLSAEPAHPAPLPAQPAAQAEWTVMVYMDGDNNLEYAALMDFFFIVVLYLFS